MFNFKDALEDLEKYDLMANTRCIEEKAENMLKSIISSIKNNNIAKESIKKLCFYVEKRDGECHLKVDYCDANTGVFKTFFVSEAMDFETATSLGKAIEEELVEEGFEIKSSRLNSVVFMQFIINTM